MYFVACGVHRQCRLTTSYLPLSFAKNMPHICSSPNMAYADAASVLIRADLKDKGRQKRGLDRNELSSRCTFTQGI